MFDAVKDSGRREDFPTGSRRDTREGKGRYDLLSPIVMERDAKHLENGAKKYGDRNWEKGQPLSRYIDSALRHLMKYQEGHRDEDHLAAARWNIGCVIHTEEMIKRGELPAELNDLPDYLPKAKCPVKTVKSPECFYRGDGRNYFWAYLKSDTSKGVYCGMCGQMWELSTVRFHPDFQWISRPSAATDEALIDAFNKFHPGALS